MLSRSPTVLVSCIFITLYCCRPSLAASPNPCAVVPDLWTEDCRCVTKCKSSDRNTYKNSVNLDVVSWNKPAYVSSQGTCQHVILKRYCSCKPTAKNPACAANNGNYMREPGLNVDCPYTDDYPVNDVEFTTSGFVTDPADKHPYWYVDLGKVYSIGIIRYYVPKPGVSKVDDPRPLSYRELGMTFYVDAAVCYQTPKELSGASFDSVQKIMMFEVIFAFCPGSTGRYVRVQKTPAASRENQPLQSVQIIVLACTNGTYMKDQGKWSDGTGIVYFTRGKATYRSERYPACSLTCRRAPDCIYPCDGFYGCNSPETTAMYNLVIRRGVTVVSEDQSYPKDFAVDGVGAIGYKWCYSSLPLGGQATNPHFLRVAFSSLSVVFKARLIFVGNDVSIYNGLSIRVARDIAITQQGQQPNDVVCFTLPDPVSASTYPNGEAAANCHQCNSIKDKCPRGNFVTVVSKLVHGGVLKLCELEVMGWSFAELATGEQCGHCIFTDCAAGTCENSVCKSEVGGGCKANEECIGKSVCVAGRCVIGRNENCKDNINNCTPGTFCLAENDFHCRFPIGSTCSNDDDCDAYAGQEVKCDYDKKCRIKPGGTCGTDAGLCSQGAQCEASMCQCKSPTSVPSGDGNRCEPLVFNKACTSDADCSAAGFLTCTNGHCQCQTGFNVNFTSFACEKHCSDLTPCPAGWNCDGSGYCRVSKGGACRHTLECPPDVTVCDLLERQCRSVLEQACNADTDCQTGLRCQVTCKIKRGSPCTPASTNPCEDGFVCKQSASSKGATICVIQLGQPCTVSGGDVCEIGAICDKGWNKMYTCRIDVGNQCTTSTDFCRFNTECKNGLCRVSIGMPCESQSYCDSGQICDIDKTCRLEKMQNCSKTPILCRIGSYCSENICVCHPDTSKDENCSVPETGIKPDALLYEPCIINTTTTEIQSIKNISVKETVTISTSNCREGFICDSKTLTCTCNIGYAPHFDMTCMPAAGSACAEPPVKSKLDGTLSQCVSGTICDLNNVCRIDVNQPCFGAREHLCRSGANCDFDQRCRLIPGYSCADGKAEYCLKGLVCDSFGICSLPVNLTCEEDFQCSAGSLCRSVSSQQLVCQCDPRFAIADAKDSSQTCKIKDGQVGGKCKADGTTCTDSNAQCTTGTCVCKPQYRADRRDFSCKLAEGAPCSAVDTCFPGLTCDKKDNICLPGLGSPCSKSNNTVCAAGVICDIDKMCKYDIGAKCQDGTECPVGTVCDILHTCKRGKDSSCNSTDNSGRDECLGGAKCVGSLCQCNPAVTDSHITNWCAPLPGYVGGKCKGNGVCDVPGALCSTSTQLCECGQTYVASSWDLSCAGASTAVEEETSLGKTFLITLLLFLGGLLVVGCVVVMRSKKASAKEEGAKSEMEGRRQTLTKVKRASNAYLAALKGEASTSVAETSSAMTSYVMTSNVGTLTDASTALSQSAALEAGSVI